LLAPKCRVDASSQPAGKLEKKQKAKTEGFDPIEVFVIARSRFMFNIV
jgi:hypothetical protein